MFKVENADFIADKLASELLPNQEFREAYKNAEEAIERRIGASNDAKGGRIEFDVDWPLRAKGTEWLIACADNGDGMTRAELERYMTTLAVRGAGEGITGESSGSSTLLKSGKPRPLREFSAWILSLSNNAVE